MRSKGSMCSKGSMRSKGWDFRLPMLVFSPIFKEVKSVLGGVENLHPLQIRLGFPSADVGVFTNLQRS